MPAILATVPVISVWDLVAFRLGPSPHRTIGLFDGLGRLAVRLIVLLGTLKSFAEGEQIMKRVEDEWERATAAGETPILITHSLGTVIGLDVVQKLHQEKLPLFITMGSPLGSEWIQSRLKSNDFPQNVARWINVYDPVDIVTQPDQNIRNDFGGLSLLRRRRWSR